MPRGLGVVKPSLQFRTDRAVVAVRRAHLAPHWPSSTGTWVAGMAIGGLGVYGDDGIRGRRSGCLVAAVTTWVRSATIPRHHPLGVADGAFVTATSQSCSSTSTAQGRARSTGEPVTNTEVDVLTWSSGERGVTSTAPYYALASAACITA